MCSTRAKTTLNGPIPCSSECVLINVVVRVDAVIIIVIVVVDGLFDLLILIWSILISLDLTRVKQTYCESLSLSEPSLEPDSEPESDSPEESSSSDSSSSYSTSMLVKGVAFREDRRLCVFSEDVRRF